MWSFTTSTWYLYFKILIKKCQKSYRRHRAKRPSKGRSKCVDVFSRFSLLFFSILSAQKSESTGKQHWNCCCTNVRMEFVDRVRVSSESFKGKSTNDPQLPITHLSQVQARYKAGAGMRKKNAPRRDQNYGKLVFTTAGSSQFYLTFRLFPGCFAGSRM